MKAVAIRSDLVDKVWPLVARWVVQALVKGNGDISPDWVRQSLEANTMRLWVAWDDEANKAVGCCICEIEESVRGRACNFVVIAGTGLRKWMHLVEDIKTVAREAGCTRLKSYSRDGMVKMLIAEGWRVQHTVMELEL